MAEKKEAAKKSGGLVEETQSTVDGAAEGWKVDHAQEAQTTQTADGLVVGVKPAEYRAWKRSQANNQLVEITGTSPDDLAARIADWEATQRPAEPSAPTEEQIMNSAKATLHMSVTADARPAIDVDVRTDPPAEAEAAQKRLVVQPPIEEVPLDKEDQTLKQPASTGVGTGQQSA
jgi:hypothetical protein